MNGFFWNLVHGSHAPRNPWNLDIALENPGKPLNCLEGPWKTLEINIMVRNATYSQNITVWDAMYSSNISIIIGPCKSVCAQYPRSIQRTIQFMRRWYLWYRVNCPKRGLVNNEWTGVHLHTMHSANLLNVHPPIRQHNLHRSNHVAVFKKNVQR